MFVYWIHLPNQNIVSEGYVGISKNPHNRLKSHKTRSQNPHLLNAFAKYGDSIILDIILEGDERQCKETEAQLRPSKDIGWNIEVGGGKPPTLYGHTFNRGKTAWNKGKKTGPKPYRPRRPHSEDHKAAIGNANRKPKPKLTCPHCGKEGGAPQIKRWHLDNCLLQKEFNSKGFGLGEKTKVINNT